MRDRGREAGFRSVSFEIKKAQNMCSKCIYVYEVMLSLVFKLI